MVHKSAYRIRKATDVVLIALFGLVIWLPAADSIFRLDKSRSLVEKRELAEKPVFSLRSEDMLKYPRRYEAYFNDHFGYRIWLIRVHHRTKFQLLGMTPSPSVMIGKEGWYFYARERVVEYYRATIPFSEEQLAEWQQVLEERRNWLAERGIRFLFVIPPGKHTLYAEYLPDWMTRVGKKSRLDQFLEHMQASSDVEILDLRDAFFEAKKRERIYHRTDTHWNDVGVFVACREIILRLSKWFPAAKPSPESDFTCKRVLGPGLDLARMLGQQKSIKEEMLVLVPKKPRLAQRVDAADIAAMQRCKKRGETIVTECENGQIPRAVMFRDSMAVALVPFLSEHFGRIVYLWTYGWEAEIIERERPDVVIYEMGERQFMKKHSIETAED